MKLIKTLVATYNRDRTMYNNIFATVIVKALSLFLNIVSISAYLHYFSNDSLVYGVWLTIISVLNWIITFDLGIGNGLRNKLVDAMVNDDRVQQRILISSAYILITILALVVVCVFSFVSLFVNWNSLLNVENSYLSSSVLVTSTFIVVAGLMIHFVLKLILSVLYAIKKTAIGSITTLSINLLMVLFTMTFRASDRSIGLIRLSIVYAIVMVLPLLIISIYTFAFRFPYAIPSFRFFEWDCAVSVLSLGIQFLSVQVLLLLINSTNEYLITHYSNPTYVVEYNAYFRLFSALIALFSVIVNPVWSSIAECYVSHDYAGVVWRAKNVFLIASAVSIVAICVTPFLPTLVELLYPSLGIHVRYDYTLWFAMCAVLTIFINAVSCIENGLSYIRYQIVGNAAAALIKFPLCFVLFRVFGGWISVVISNCVVLSVSLVIQLMSLKKLSSLYT